jgi:RNA methyltransferase, TrmH family
VITSTDNPRVKEVVRLRRAGERRRTGLFVAEGPREVGRALAAGLAVRAVYVAPELMPDWSEFSGAAGPPDWPEFSGGAGRPGAADPPAGSGSRPDPSGPPTRVTPTEVSARVLARMSYRAEPEGVLAVVAAPRRALPESPTLLLVAVGIEKPGNLGAMARTVDAAGADALLVAEAQVDPWNPNAIRASTGAVFTLPIVETTLDELAALPVQKVAASLGVHTAHTRADLGRPTAILIGAEDAGLPDDWRALADVEVEIPMRGATADSLNASAAAAVLLFEAVRQRS